MVLITEYPRWPMIWVGKVLFGRRPGYPVAYADASEDPELPVAEGFREDPQGKLVFTAADPSRRDRCRATSFSLSVKNRASDGFHGR